MTLLELSIRSENARPFTRRFKSASTGITWMALSALMRKPPRTAVRSRATTSATASIVSLRRAVAAKRDSPAGVSRMRLPERSNSGAPMVRSSART